MSVVYQTSSVYKIRWFTLFITVAAVFLLFLATMANLGKNKSYRLCPQVPGRHFSINPQLFLCGLAFRPDVSGECGMGIRDFLIPLYRVESFQTQTILNRKAFSSKWNYGPPTRYGRPVGLCERCLISPNSGLFMLIIVCVDPT